jgi:DNA methylase
MPASETHTGRRQRPGTTNVRRNDGQLPRLLNRLRQLLRAATVNGFAIGDSVNKLKEGYGYKVKDIAAMLGASAQRLAELRRTALAFPRGHRSEDVDIHFYTIAARAARRLGLSPAEVLREIVQQRLDSTRQATRYLAARIAALENARAGKRTAQVIAQGRAVNDRCHFGDYRKLVKRIPRNLLKCIIADAPYGQYGQFADGKHTQVAATRLACDGMRNDEAIAATVDLFRLGLPRLASGGCMVLFRPGGQPDPPWLMNAAEEYGWSCSHALTWSKGHIQLANSAAPYSISSERLLVFARQGDRLINHDCSDRSDVLRFPPIRPTYVNGHEHHLFEKPNALMRHLIMKHTYTGETVFEPFGGTAAASVAAIELDRHWICSESNQSNHEMACARLAQAVHNNSRVG